MIDASPAKLMEQKKVCVIVRLGNIHKIIMRTANSL